MSIAIGTSGFGYAAWKGSFYPAGLADDDMLPFYARAMKTVEINNTYYRMPHASMLEGWAGKTPDDFCFVLKAPRFFGPAMSAEKSEAIASFFAIADQGLGKKLGPVLVSIASKKKDVKALSAFLARFPEGREIAIEFKGESWFCEDVYEALRARASALCISDDDALAAPVVVTAPWAYFRLRRVSYSDSDLDVWAERIAASAPRSYVFFKHEDEATGPKLAAKLAARLAARRPV